jgi:hypothetical protein
MVAFSVLRKILGFLQNRVALGGLPPRAPTDPYVRDYRIRFLRYDFATRHLE